MPVIFNGQDWWRRQQLVSLRRDCRGLVVGQGGKVQARPVQKFFKIGDLGVLADSGSGWQEVVMVTEKLDGEMMVGLVVGEAVELWSRGGWTELHPLRAAVEADRAA